MLISVLFFTLCWLFSYKVCKKSYSFTKAKSFSEVDEVYVDKISLLSCLMIALFCTCYNFYVTEFGIGYGSDRTNYLESFVNGRFESVGLMTLIDLVHYLGGTFNHLLYFSTFFSVFVVMLAYKFSTHATPSSISLFFLSPFVFQTFSALKQCYATAIATLVIMLMLQKKTFKKEVLIIFLILLACQFHAAAYLLVFIYAIFRLNISVNNVRKVIFITLLIVFFFKQFMLFVASLASGISPYLVGKIFEYFGEDAMEADRGIMVLLKGLPYYYITYIAVKYRKLLIFRIRYFDKYLLLSIVGSIFYLSTIYNVWLSRATDLLSFAMIVLWTQMIYYIPDQFRRNRLEFLLMILFTYRWLIMIYINFGTF